MKITIAYTAEEQREAGTIEALIRGLNPGVKLRRSDRYAPFMHTYLTITKPENPCGSKENA